MAVKLDLIRKILETYQSKINTDDLSKVKNILEETEIESLERISSLEDIASLYVAKQKGKI